MRLGLDLRSVPDPEQREALAVEADRLGLWAVLVGGAAGTEVAEAAALATATDHIHLAVLLDGTATHALTLAEEVAVLDHLSARRALALVDGPPSVVEHVDRLLAGRVVDGVALTPPPAQTRVPVWPADELDPIQLTGDLDTDRRLVDDARRQGHTHRFVGPPSSLTVLARHLVPRAAVPDFPQMVADLADTIG